MADSSSTCPTENELLAFVAGATERRADLEGHLSGCERCRVAVANVASRTASSTRAPGQQRRGDEVGRYLVLELVGEGAMGRVYAAYDPVLDRKVALKLLHPLSDGPDGQERLLREAKALAKVAHPHLVAVHDAGTFADSVFLAMEFVDGQTLRAWLAQKKRSDDEVLEAFLQAGRGLAAAHEAGLVHRDFKPENVLVGRDGRVRVSDFGLARELGAATSTPSREALALPSPDGSPRREEGAVDAHASLEQTAKPATPAVAALVTATGALVGTPAYMAPEQLTGQRADPRADQFAFCVALAEALQGARPFTKNSAEVVRRGPSLRTASRLARVLQRGLSLEPTARFPSMQALLAALAPPASRASTRALPAAALVLTLVALAAFARQRSTLCASGPERVAAVWSNDRQERLRAHFASLGSQDTFQRIHGELDRWAAAWAAQHREACEATRLRGEQSDQVFTVRMACLDRRLVDLDGALGVLATTGPESLARAQDPVLSLTPLSVCANSAALLVPVPKPEAPALRERADTIERELARARALRESGRFVEGLPIATSAALEAHGLAWAPLEAEALFVRGQLLEGASDLPGAESALRDAFTRAHAARDDRLATLIALELSFVQSQQARLKESDEWVWQASALAPRVGVDWELASKLANQQGHLHSARTEFASAEVRYRTAWALRRDHQGPSHPKTVTILANLASSIGAQGRFEQSAELLTEVARQLEASLGRAHHKVGQSWNGVAEQYIALHRPAEALALIDGIFAEQLAALGPSSQYVGRLRYGRAEALRGLGRLDEATAEYQQALKVFDDASMPLMAGIASSALGATACQAGRLDEGLAAAARAREVLVKAFGEAHEEATVALEVQGECLLEAGQPQRARSFFTRSLEAREKAGDDDWTARSLVGLGRTHLALGQVAEGRALLTRGARSLERSKLDAVLLATAQKALGVGPALDGGR
jgi:serine/threonine protein kinase/predicted negative regulator of RcsB-dependent stress response